MQNWVKIFRPKRGKAIPIKRQNYIIMPQDNSENSVQRVLDYLNQAFPNQEDIIKDEEYTVKFQTELDEIKVAFLIYFAGGNVYLRITIPAKPTVRVIKCLEQIHKRIIETRIEKEFILVVTYDSISEYYCNKIYPFLNEMDRNLRTLMFDVFILNLGKNYYWASIGQDTVNRAKKTARLTGNKRTKEIEAIKKVFYSLDYSDIRNIFFEKCWTSYDEDQRQQFLGNIQDLSSLTDKELREAFLASAPRNNWDRFFKGKLSSEVEEVFSQIQDYRNNIAHCKFFYRKDYEECYKLIKQLNKELVLAIKRTEDNDIVYKRTAEIMSVPGNKDLFDQFCDAQEEYFNVVIEHKMDIPKEMVGLIDPKEVETEQVWMEEYISLRTGIPMNLVTLFAEHAFDICDYLGYLDEDA